MRTTRNSFVRSKNRNKVVGQIATPIVDSDFNEAQDILSVAQAETALACFSSLRATNSGVLRQGYALGDDWKVYSTGGNTLFVTKGTLWVDGYQITLDADQNMGIASGAPGTGGQTVYGYAFIDVVVQERDSSSDPTIAVPFIGEAAGRTVLNVTYRISESLTSFDAAFSAITALPTNPDATVWNGYVARVFLARYMHVGNAAAIPVANVLDLRHSPPGELANKIPMLKFNKAPNGDAANEGNNRADGYVLWKPVDASNGYLTFGNYGGFTSPDAPTDADKLLGQLTIITPGAPKHRVGATATTGGVAQQWQQAGSGTNTGTAPNPNNNTGFNIPQGYALGYIAPGATSQINDFRTKKGSTADVISVTPAVASAAMNVNQSGLIVAPLSAFEARLAPGTFILCHRDGDDLIWWNNHVTSANRTQPTLDDPTGTIPANLHLVVGDKGSVHGGAAWALQMGINALTAGGGAGSFGAGRQLRAYIEATGYLSGGSQLFAQGRVQIGDGTDTGQSSTFSANNQLFQLEGDGAGLTRIAISCVSNAQRIGCAELEVRGVQRIVLRDLTLTAIGDDTHKRGYLAFLEGKEVILENCHFVGAIGIAGDRVTIRNCTFTNDVVTSYFASLSQGYQVGAHLSLLGPCGYTDPGLYSFNQTAYAGGGAPTTGMRWLVEGCRFTVYHDGSASNGLLGHCASMLVGGSDVTVATGRKIQPRLTVRDCEWDYQVDTSAQAYQLPAIHVRTGQGNITVEDCAFRNANGIAKAGVAGNADISAGTDLAGSICYQPTQRATELVAAAYISVTKGREVTSRLSVRRCTFHFGRVGAATGNASYYCVWGACAVVANKFSQGETVIASTGVSAVPVRICNVVFEDNRVLMFADDSVGAAFATASTNNPYVYGFMCINDWAWGGPNLTDLMGQNIVVKGNSFNLGGATGTNSSLFRSVQGVLPRTPNSATYNWMYFTSAPVMISAGYDQVAYGATPTIVYPGLTGKRFSSIKVIDNDVSIDLNSANGYAESNYASGANATAGAPQPATAPTVPLWAFVGIAVTGGFSSGGSGGMSSSPGGGAGQVEIKGNSFFVPYFAGNKAPAGGQATAIFSGCNPCVISENQFYMSGDNNYCVESIGVRTLLADNIVDSSGSAVFASRGSGTALVAGNNAIKKRNNSAGAAGGNFAALASGSVVNTHSTGNPDANNNFAL